MAYIIAFGLIISLSWIYEHSRQVKYNPITRITISIIILLIPALLSAMRDISVGTDTISYYNRFISARHSTLSSFILRNSNQAGGETIELGFLFFIYFLSRFVSSFELFEFSLTIITFGIFFKGAKYFYRAKNYSLTLMTAVYLFVYYCPFLNYQRQGLAISMLWYSLVFIEKKRFVSFFIILAFAVNVHFSSIVFLFYYIIIRKSDTINNKHIFLLMFSSVIILCLGPQLIYRALELISRFGVRSATILKYSRHFNWAESYEIHFSQLLMSLPQLIVFTLLFKKFIAGDGTLKAYYCISIIHFLLTVIGSVDANFGRLAISAGICEILIVSDIYHKCTYNGQKIVATIPIFIYLISYWLFYTANNMYYFTKPVYPYLLSMS